MDRLSPTQRRRLMARVKSKGTRPEREMATLLCSLRYHFSSHDASLPGTPDFVLNRHKLAIFVHGCFWHAHSWREAKACPQLAGRSGGGRKILTLHVTDEPRRPFAVSATGCWSYGSAN